MDDVLFSGAPEIRVEFMRRVRVKHDVTGGDEPVSKFCGYEFRYDLARETIQVHQQAFAVSLLEQFDALTVKAVETPMLVGTPELEGWEGVEVSERTKLDYMVGRVSHVADADEARPGVCGALAEPVRQPAGPGASGGGAAGVGAHQGHVGGRPDVSRVGHGH